MPFQVFRTSTSSRFEEFVEIVKHQPAQLFVSLREFCLEWGRRINLDWFVQAAFAIAKTEDGWQITEPVIHHWLHCYNKDATDQTNRYPKSNDAESVKRLQRTEEKIQETLSSLSPFESGVLSGMTEVTGDTDSLFSLALQLMAGRPLAGFAESFVALGFGFALDTNVHSARKAFHQLTTFNRVDREAAANAFATTIQPLESTDASVAGQWTVVRILYATGDEAAAKKANELAKNLQKDWPRFDPPPADEWQQAKATDPDAQRPVNFDDGLQSFLSIGPDQIMRTMNVAVEDRNYRDFLPIACRFEPKSAIEKTREIMAELLTRTGMPLRQIIFNGEEMMPLVTRDLATQLIRRVTDSDMIESLSVSEQDILRLLLLNFIAEQLSPEEQLACLSDEAFGSDLALDTASKIKPQCTEDVIASLQTALDANNERAAFGILTAALYGDTRITPELEALVLRSTGAQTSILRAISFELAANP